MMPPIARCDHDRDQGALRWSGIRPESEDCRHRSRRVEAATLPPRSGVETASCRSQRLAQLRRPERQAHRLPGLEPAERVGRLVEATPEIINRGEPEAKPLDAPPHVPQPVAQPSGAVGGVGVASGHGERQLVGLPDHRRQLLEDDLEGPGGTGAPRSVGVVGGHARDGRSGGIAGGSSCLVPDATRTSRFCRQPGLILRRWLPEPGRRQPA